jgi:hypothetical protein
LNIRRKLILAPGAGARAAPLCTFAQQQGKIRRIGFQAGGRVDLPKQAPPKLSRVASLREAVGAAPSLTATEAAAVARLLETLKARRRGLLPKLISLQVR